MTRPVGSDGEESSRFAGPKARDSLARSLLQGPRALPLALHFTACLILFLIHIGADDPETTLRWGGAVLLPAYLALSWIAARRSPLFITPLSFYFAWYSFGLGLSPIFLAGEIASGGPVNFGGQPVWPADLAAGYLIFVLGSFALHAGLITLSHRASSKGEDAHPAFPTWTLGVLWLVGILSMSYLKPLADALGSIAGLLSWASLAALIGYALRGRKQERTLWFWLILIAGIVIELAFRVSSTSKALVMYCFLPLGWLFLTTKRLRGLLVLGAPLLAGLYLLVLQPVMSQARRHIRMSDDPPIEVIMRVYASDDYEVDLEEEFSHFFYRQFDPLPVGFVYSEVNRHGFMGGATMDYLTYAFIPRLLWPNKPTVSRGEWFTAYLGLARREEEATSSTGLTAPGELYWNFGLGAVVSGMYLIGLLIGWQTRWCGSRPEDHPLKVLLYVLLVFAMPAIGEFGADIVGQVFRILFFGSTFFILHLLTKRIRPSIEAQPIS